MDFPILSIILLAPVAGVIFLLFIPKDEFKLIKSVAAIALGASFGLTVYTYFAYNQTAGGLQFVERYPWINDLGVTLFLGVDGLSLPMLLLVTMIGFAAVFASWNVSERPREFMILFMLLVVGVMGTFVAQDLFIFLLFYEVVVIPIYIMVIIWGSSKRVTKEYAGMKLTIYLLIGSAFLLVGVIAVFVRALIITGVPDFSFTGLAQVPFPVDFQIYMFALMLLGFGSLLSMWPFHSWSPDGYAGAPTAVSMIHAGVLKKIGGYGLIRIALYVLPAGAQFWAPFMAVLGVAGVAYAAFAALAQKDLKYVIGYSSVSHMGYVLLGIASLNVIGINGAVATMFGHGVMAALFFSTVGFIYEKTHSRWIPDFGGLSQQVPRLAVAFLLAGLASLGLPGLVTFVPEFTTFIGAFKVYGGLAVVAITGVILTALYILRAAANTMFGPKRAEWDHLVDIRGPEMVPLVVLGVFLVVFGLLPSLLMDMVNNGVAPLVAEISDVLQIGGRF
ncbi:MAG: NADH-quinone oxidoreductase subunit M [Peptococcaceae bacterium]|jgi:NADH-quinone oxidoreductase subunit M|nr:MAG: NADH-quinone oxidoreductase subunit M [Peptococcaceae bacterium]